MALASRKNSKFRVTHPSKPVFIARMKALPKNALYDLQAMHEEYIWDPEKPKIKHSVLIGHYGGFRDVDLSAKFKSIKYIWIEKMF